MNFSPAVDAEVPETPNGVPSSENSPYFADPSKCVGRKVDFSEDSSRDGSFRHAENHVDGIKGLDDHYREVSEMGDIARKDHFSLDSSEDADTAPSDDAVVCPAVQEDKSQKVSHELMSWRGHPFVADMDSGEEEKEKHEEDEKNEKKWWNESQGEKKEIESLHHYSSSAPGPSTSYSRLAPASLHSGDDAPCPPHVMAQVWVRNVRGMQDSKSLDEISQACGGGVGTRGAGRGGQSEGRRATISSALELEGTVSHEGDLTNFITKNLEQKIKMSSKPSLDCSDSDCSGPIYRSRGLLRRLADIPPIDPTVLVDLQRHTQDIAQSVEMMMRSLNGTIQNMTALSVGYIQTYRDSVDSLGESVDMSIKGMYTLMARCEELDRSMQPINILAAQIRDIKRTLDALEAICK
nr:BLOC-1-related complex subunit 6-like [Nerophis lumbriciformis]